MTYHSVLLGIPLAAVGTCLYRMRDLKPREQAEPLLGVRFPRAQYFSYQALLPPIVIRCALAL